MTSRNWLPEFCRGARQRAPRRRRTEFLRPRIETLLEERVVPATACNDLFAFAVGANTWKIPYCHNFDLDAPNPDVTRVVIAVHGVDRNAPDYYRYALDAATADGVADHTLIVAPQFLNEADITDNNLADDVLYWNAPWRDGARSSSTAQHRRADRVSSYEVLDDLLTHIADSGNFPYLDTVVVSGHSAGGQFTQRYAATNTEETHLSGDDGLSVRYVPMNPSSYLYLNANRWDPTTQTFTVLDGHAGYNNYPYGLDNVSSPEYYYIANQDPDTIRTQYEQRQVSYLLGDQDIDRNDPNLDRSDAADVQGYVRFERGNIYFAYLQDYYGPDILNYQVRETVPGVAHEGNRMYASAQAAVWIFGVDPHSQPGAFGARAAGLLTPADAAGVVLPAQALPVAAQGHLASPEANKMYASAQAAVWIFGVDSPAAVPDSGYSHVPAPVPAGGAAMAASHGQPGAFGARAAGLLTPADAAGVVLPVQALPVVAHGHLASPEAVRNDRIIDFTFNDPSAIEPAL
jgi:hypothetical protein